MKSRPEDLKLRNGIGLTYANPLRTVLDALKIDLVSCKRHRVVAAQTPSHLKKARAAKAAAEKVFTELQGDVAIGITRIDGASGWALNCS